MNPKRLQHFEQIIEAPDAVLRLRRFYLEYLDCVGRICQTPSGQLQGSSMSTSERQFNIAQMSSAQLAPALPLSWSQCVFLLGIRNDADRCFYEIAGALQSELGGGDDEP